MTTLSVITHDAFALHPVPMGHPERPDRIRHVWQALDEDFHDLPRFEAPEASAEAIARVHGDYYLDLIAEQEPAEGMISLDPDTHMGKGTLEASQRAAGGAVMAVDQVMTGQADRVFLAARPPGHHAEPHKPMGFCLFSSAAIADIMTGMYATTGILAALRHRDHTGEGQYIDLALVDTQVSWLANQGVNHLLSGNVPKSSGNGHPNIVPYQVFPTADGYIIIAVGNDTQFAAFVDILGQPALAQDPRFTTNPLRLKHKDDILPILEKLIRSFARDDLLAACESRGVPAGPVNNLGDVFATDQVAAREMRIKMDYPDAASGEIELIGNPLKFSKTPVSYRRAPPKCGAHNQDVLSDWLGGDAPTSDDPEA